MKKLIVFDLDGTLADSKSAVDPEMSGLLHDLLGIVKVAVISGGGWPQFEKQFVSNLPTTNSWRIYLSFLLAAQSFTDTNLQIGKRSIRRISLQIKEKRSSIPSRRRSELQTSRSTSSGVSKSRTAEAR